MVTEDIHYMQQALRLASHGLGNVWPSPAVGCVIMKDKQVIGRGWTQPGGHPHAESLALQQAGTTASGATVYVTLEPCFQRRAHENCLSLLEKASVARVVMGCIDPDPRTHGQSIAALQAHGIQTEVGILKEQCEALNAGFFLRLQKQRPFITLKAATSLDGKIALANRQSKWLTGDASRDYAQLLRAQHDAVLAGINTVLADDPLLTCRLPGLPKRPTVRVVLDSNLRLLFNSQLIQSTNVAPLWVMTCQPAGHSHAQALLAKGAEIISVIANDRGQIDIHAAMRVLADRGITRLMVEGGAHILSSFYQASLWDELALFQAPVILGNDSHAAWQELGLEKLSDSQRLKLVEQKMIGNDIYTCWKRA